MKFFFIIVFIQFHLFYFWMAFFFTLFMEFFYTLFNFTPFHYAVQNDHIEIVKLFLELPNFDINQPTIFTFVIIYSIFIIIVFNLVSIMLMFLWDFFSWYSNYTAIHLAAERGNNEILKWLLTQKGIDINAQTIWIINKINVVFLIIIL